MQPYDAAGSSAREARHETRRDLDAALATPLSDLCSRFRAATFRRRRYTEQPDAPTYAAELMIANGTLRVDEHAPHPYPIDALLDAVRALFRGVLR